MGNYCFIQQNIFGKTNYNTLNIIVFELCAKSASGYGILINPSKDINSNSNRIPEIIQRENRENIDK